MASFVSTAAQSAVELVEPVPAPTIYVSGVASIVDLGDGTVCTTMFILVPCLDGSGLEKQVAVRIVTPLSAFPPGMQMAEQVIAENGAAKRAAH